MGARSIGHMERQGATVEKLLCTMVIRVKKGRMQRQFPGEKWQVVLQEVGRSNGTWSFQ